MLPFLGLRINEVVAVSAAKSRKPDWVELANTTGSPIDLSGYYLTDSKTDLKKWALSGTVESGGYLVVQSALSRGGKNRTVPLCLGRDPLSPQP